MAFSGTWLERQRREEDMAQLIFHVILCHRCTKLGPLARPDQKNYYTHTLIVILTNIPANVLPFIHQYIVNVSSYQLYQANILCKCFLCPTNYLNLNIFTTMRNLWSNLHILLRLIRAGANPSCQSGQIPPLLQGQTQKQATRERANPSYSMSILSTIISWSVICYIKKPMKQVL